MGLTGLALAPTPTVATVPLALVPIGTMLLTVPAAHLMSRRGRKAGVIIGAALGVVGAGGLGFYVFLYVKQFQWEKTGVLCLAIVLLVFAGEFVSWQVRKRLL